MSKTYTNQNNIERFREPVFNIHRAKFRGTRSSHAENLETNLLKIDFSRILNELNSVQNLIDDDIIYLIGDINDVNESVLLDDGLSYLLDGIQFYDDNNSTLDDLRIDTIGKISGRLSRLFNKVQRLENGDL